MPTILWWLLVGFVAAGPLVSDVNRNQLASDQCGTCTFVVDVLHNLWGEKIFEDCMMDLVIYICETFRIEDHFVCSTIVKGFEDEAMWVLGQIIVEPSQICGLLLKDCGHLFNPFNGTWSVPFPGTQPPFTPPAVPPSGKPTLRVLHLTDIHLDMYYEVGSEASCEDPTCCRGYQNPNEITKGAAATSPPVKNPAGYWGTVGDCDATYWLFTNMLDHIKATHKDIDYILVSGDLMSHADWDYTRPTHQAMVRNISDSIRSRFPNIPSYFSVGNHEGVPIDTFAPRFTPERFHMDWLYDTMADSWQGWVPQDQDAVVRHMGSYAVKLFPGLRLISVNTPLGGDSVNFFLYVNQTDPDGTMTWLVNQLADAEKAGDKVHITAHIPGGDGECLEGWSINYYNAVNRYANIIVGQFFGHTHSEEFYVMYANPEDHTSQPTGVIYSAPSVTTYSEFNPAYRIYTIDGNYTGSTFGVIDFEDWFFNLTVNTEQSKATWAPLYMSVLKEYGLKNTNPSEWNNLIERMKTDDVLFAKYRKNYYRRTDTAPCDHKCKMDWLCSARKAHHSDKLCVDLQGATGLNRPPMYRREPSPPYNPTKNEVSEMLLKKRISDECKA